MTQENMNKAKPWIANDLLSFPLKSHSHRFEGNTRLARIMITEGGECLLEDGHNKILAFFSTTSTGSHNWNRHQQLSQFKHGTTIRILTYNYDILKTQEENLQFVLIVSSWQHTTDVLDGDSQLSVDVNILQAVRSYLQGCFMTLSNSGSSSVCLRHSHSQNLTNHSHSQNLTNHSHSQILSCLARLANQSDSQNLANQSHSQNLINQSNSQILSCLTRLANQSDSQNLANQSNSQILSCLTRLANQSDRHNFSSQTRLTNQGVDSSPIQQCQLQQKYTSMEGGTGWMKTASSTPRDSRENISRAASSTGGQATDISVVCIKETLACSESVSRTILGVVLQDKCCQRGGSQTRDEEFQLSQQLDFDNVREDGSLGDRFLPESHHNKKADTHDVTESHHNKKADTHDVTESHHNKKTDTHDVTESHHNKKTDTHDVTESHNKKADTHDVTESHNKKADTHDVTESHNKKADTHDVTESHNKKADTHDVTEECISPTQLLELMGQESIQDSSKKSDKEKVNHPDTGGSQQPVDCHKPPTFLGGDCQLQTPTFWDLFVPSDQMRTLAQVPGWMSSANSSVTSFPSNEFQRVSSSEKNNLSSSGSLFSQPTMKDDEHISHLSDRGSVICVKPGFIENLNQTRHNSIINPKLDSCDRQNSSGSEMNKNNSRSLFSDTELEVPSLVSLDSGLKQDEDRILQQQVNMCEGEESKILKSNMGTTSRQSNTRMVQTVDEQVSRRSQYYKNDSSPMNTANMDNERQQKIFKQEKRKCAKTDNSLVVSDRSKSQFSERSSRLVKVTTAQKKSENPSQAVMSRVIDLSSSSSEDIYMIAGHDIDSETMVSLTEPEFLMSSTDSENLVSSSSDCGSVLFIDCEKVILSSDSGSLLLVDSEKLISSTDSQNFVSSSDSASVLFVDSEKLKPSTDSKSVVLTDSKSVILRDTCLPSTDAKSATHIQPPPSVSRTPLCPNAISKHQRTKHKKDRETCHSVTAIASSDPSNNGCRNSSSSQTEDASFTVLDFRAISRCQQTSRLNSLCRQDVTSDGQGVHSVASDRQAVHCVASDRQSVHSVAKCSSSGGGSNSSPLGSNCAGKHLKSTDSIAACHTVVENAELTVSEGKQKEPDEPLATQKSQPHKSLAPVDSLQTNQMCQPLREIISGKKSLSNISSQTCQPSIEGSSGREPSKAGSSGREPFSNSSCQTCQPSKAGSSGREPFSNSSCQTCQPSKAGSSSSCQTCQPSKAGSSGREPFSNSSCQTCQPSKAGSSGREPFSTSSCQPSKAGSSGREPFSNSSCQPSKEGSSGRKPFSNSSCQTCQPSKTGSSGREPFSTSSCQTCQPSKAGSSGREPFSNSSCQPSKEGSSGRKPFSNSSCQTCQPSKTGSSGRKPFSNSSCQPSKEGSSGRKPFSNSSCQTCQPSKTGSSGRKPFSNSSCQTCQPSKTGSSGRKPFSNSSCQTCQPSKAGSSGRKPFSNSSCQTCQPSKAGSSGREPFSNSSCQPSKAGSSGREPFSNSSCQPSKEGSSGRKPFSNSSIQSTVEIPVSQPRVVLTDVLRSNKIVPDCINFPNIHNAGHPPLITENKGQQMLPDKKEYEQGNSWYSRTRSNKRQKCEDVSQTGFKKKRFTISITETGRYDVNVLEIKTLEQSNCRPSRRSSCRQKDHCEDTNSTTCFTRIRKHEAEELHGQGSQMKRVTYIEGNSGNISHLSVDGPKTKKPVTVRDCQPLLKTFTYESHESDVGLQASSLFKNCAAPDWKNIGPVLDSSGEVNEETNSSWSVHEDSISKFLGATPESQGFESCHHESRDGMFGSSVGFVPEFRESNIFSSRHEDESRDGAVESSEGFVPGFMESARSNSEDWNNPWECARLSQSLTSVINYVCHGKLL